MKRLISADILRATAILLMIQVHLVSPLLRDAFGYHSHWIGGEYRYDFTMSDVSLGFFLQGYFPIFPWLIFPLLGFATGKYFFSTDYPARLQTWTMPALGAGLLILATLGHALYLAGVPQFYADDVLSFYPASTTFVLGTLGLIFFELVGIASLAGYAASRTRWKGHPFLSALQSFLVDGVYCVSRGARLSALLFCMDRKTSRSVVLLC